MDKMDHVNRRISIIIPVLNKSEKINNSYDSIFRQNILPDELELIIVCAVPGYSGVIDDMCSSMAESVLIIEALDIKNKVEAFNLGIETAQGQYILFMRAGDVFHKKFLGIICKVIENFKQADLISFGITKAFDEYSFFDDDPLSEDGFFNYSLYDLSDRRAFLSENPVDERYYSLAYKREFLLEVGQFFRTDAHDDDITFAYPLFFFADSVIHSDDHAYCRYEHRSLEEKVSDRITSNMSAQTNLLQLLQNEPEIYSEYKDIIEAHFIEKYYLHSLWLGRISGEESPVKIGVFQILQLVVTRIVPHWIENKYIYAFGRKKLEMLALVNQQIDNQEDLDAALCQNNLVSIIITTHNRQEFIGNAIRNMLAQTYQAFELIIVDDASTDDTQAIVRSFSDRRIRYIRNEFNEGIAKVRNKGLDNASAEFVAYHDDDDLCRLDKLEKEMAIIWNSGNTIKAVYPLTVNHYKRIAGDLESEALFIPKLDKPFPMKSGFIFPALLPKNDIVVAAMVLNKSAVQSVGAFDESLFAYEDWEFMLRFAKEYDVVFLEEPLYDYYQRSTGIIYSTTSEKRAKIIKALYEIDKKYTDSRKKYGVPTNFIIQEVD